jgi:hypothetical protein
MRIVEARLQTASSTLAGLVHFYRDLLGVPVRRAERGEALGIGSTTVAFEPVEVGRPFYHFAFRVPRNRFAAARDWLGGRTDLLPDPSSGDTRFAFGSWNAEACYALDPGDNIVELIAHHELPEESPHTGPFTAGELLGVCELGVVVPDPRAAAVVLEPLGITLWDGTLDGGRERLAFLGGRDGVLIICRPRRGWMPTGRPAETCRVDVVAAGHADDEVSLPGTPHRVATVTRPLPR